MLLHWNTLTIGHRAYMFTGQRRHRVNVCVVLAHFYRRKPNWSARVYYYYYHHHPLLLLLSLSLFFFPFLQEFISRIHPPRLGSNPGFHATLATPYRVLNTNRDASFFASLPNKTFLNAIITINEEEANGCIGPLLYSPLLSLLSFRSSGEPLKEPRPLVLFLSFRRLSPPPHFYSKYRDEREEEEEGRGGRESGGGGRSFAADRNARLFPPVSRCAARLYPAIYNFYARFRAERAERVSRPGTATCR